MLVGVCLNLVRAHEKIIMPQNDDIGLISIWNCHVDTMLNLHRIDLFQSLCRMNGLRL